MEYALAAVIALLVVDGICSPDWFRNIRTLFQVIRGIQPHSQSGITKAASHTSVEAPIQGCKECPACKLGMSHRGIWLPATTAKHEANFLRDCD